MAFVTELKSCVVSADRMLNDPHFKPLEFDVSGSADSKFRQLVDGFREYKEKV